LGQGLGRNKLTILKKILIYFYPYHSKTIYHLLTTGGKMERKFLEFSREKLWVFRQFVSPQAGPKHFPTFLKCVQGLPLSNEDIAICARSAEK